MSLADKIKEGEAIITLKKGNSLDKNKMITQLSEYRYKVHVLSQVDGKNLTFSIFEKDGHYYGKRISLSKVRSIKYLK